jgi:membrane protein implicated in regulation of membrane protease activity
VSWWLWIVAGVALGVLEVLAPAWVFLGFALGAVGVGIALWLGGPMALAWQALLFAGLSLASWVALRAALGARGDAVKRIERDINEG